MQNFTAKWFIFYYFILGLLFAAAGLGLIIKTKTCAQYLLSRTDSEKPPALLRAVLKYFFLFTIPCLVLSFIPFKWPELIFSIWSLLIVYIAGLQLVHWPQRRQALKSQAENLPKVIKLTGAMMLTVSPIIFLLGYLEMQTFF